MHLWRAVLAALAIAADDAVVGEGPVASVSAPARSAPAKPMKSASAEHEVDEWEQVLMRFNGVDPYSTWLGISVDHRPLNPYELLGVNNYETTPAKISAGLERMTNRLKSLKDSINEEHWQLVHEELEQAHKLLQDREKREE